MKIVISSKQFLPLLGGSINYGVMLAEAFLRHGADVRIITRTLDVGDKDCKLPILRCPSTSCKWKLAKWADVLMQVEASWRDAWPFILRGVPWFPTLHCGKASSSELATKISQSSLWLAYQLGNTIPVGYQVAKEWGISNQPICNPYDDLTFENDQKNLPRTNDLIYVGRIEKCKGVFVLLEAIRQTLPLLSRKITCCFVGDGPDQARLVKEAAKFGAGANFEFKGRLEPSKVAAEMRKSRILVFPTTPEWIEASPLTPLEALACGCRIIAADNGGTRENIGPDGVLVRSGDPTSLAAGLLNLLDNPPIRDLKEIEEFLSDRRLDKTASRYLECFSSII